MAIRRTKIKRGFFILAIAAFFLLGMQKEMVFAQESSQLNIYGIYLGEDEKGDCTLLESRGHGLLICLTNEDDCRSVTENWFDTCRRVIQPFA